jgi:hypothetical protein
MAVYNQWQCLEWLKINGNGNIISIRESTFIMPRGDEDVKGAPKYFLALKGGSENS